MLLDVIRVLSVALDVLALYPAGEFEDCAHPLGFLHARDSVQQHVFQLGILIGGLRSVFHRKRDEALEG